MAIEEYILLRSTKGNKEIIPLQAEDSVTGMPVAIKTTGGALAVSDETMPSGEWDMDILLERIHTPGVPLYFANTLRLYINGDYIKDVGNGHVAWEAPMPNLDPEIAPRNVPHTWRGRGWQSIGKSTSTSLSIPGNVKLFIPQQLVQYDPALLPGGACEFKWLRSETDYDE